MSFWNALVRRHAPASKASNICFRTNLKMIPHMQLADNPGRHEPGTGEINYKFLFEFIDKIGYTGWGIAEQGGGGTPEGLKDLADRMDKIFAS